MRSAMVSWLDQHLYSGYSDNWDDAAFRERILEVLKPGMQLLDVGAGAGILPHMNFRRVAGKVCGVDMDERVMQNPYLDEAHIVGAATLPYADSVFDVAISSNVLEHLDDPQAVFREVHRVLKPGGVFLFKTPNRWHYIATIARMTPTSFHRFVVGKRKSRDAHDVFPTHYLANTAGRVTKLGATCGFTHAEIKAIEGRPEYLRFSGPTYAAGALYERIVNAASLFEPFRAVLLGALHKSPTG